MLRISSKPANLDSCVEKKAFRATKTYRLSSSKVFAEYNGEFGSLCKTSTSLLTFARCVLKTFVIKEASANDTSLSEKEDDM